MAQQPPKHFANLKSGCEDNIQNVLWPFLKTVHELNTSSTRPSGDNSAKSDVVGEFRYPNLYYSTAYYPANQYKVQRIKWF